MRMPQRDAPPIPPKKVSGTLTTSAQGQETTRNTKARCTQTLHGWLNSSGGMTASRAAPATTQGVYQWANRVMKPSTLAFCSEAFSTSSSILAAVDSPKALWVLTVMTPVRLTVPLTTASPGPLSCGRLSPVRAAVLTAVVLSRMMPSSGIFSPGRMRMVSPTSTSSGSTFSSMSSRRTLA